MAYYTFRDPESGEEHGSFETFWHDASDLATEEQAESMPTGWYWWPCFPGCLPDGDPVGPFDTERDAVLDANQG